MKKKNLLKAILFVIAISSIGLALKSCSAKEGVQCSSCEQASNFNIVAKFDNSLGNLSSNARIWRDKKILGYEYADIIIKEGQKFNTISQNVETILSNSKIEENTIIAYAFYKKGNLETDSLMSIKDIFGISKYYFNSNTKKLYHQFFIRTPETNKFQEIIELNSEIDGLVSNYMHTISTEIIQLRGNSATVFVADATKGEIEDKVKDSHDLLEGKIKLYIKNNSSKNSSTQNELIEPDGNCGNPCLESGKHKCTLRVGGYYACGGTCDFRIATTMLSDSGIWVSNDSINLTYKSSLQYNFRDDVLSKSSFGGKYIDYYYSLGDDFADKIDLNAALYTGRILIDINSLMERLMSTSENVNNVLISDSVKDKIVDILNFYKNKTTNITSIANINEIINDINNLQGKTVAQVRTLLNI